MLTRGRVLALAWPVVLARSAQAVIGFCDALMTAPLGEDAVAAVTTGAMNVSAAMMLPIGVVFIVQSFASQLSAKQEHHKARRYAWYGLAIAAVAMAMGARISAPSLDPMAPMTGTAASHPVRGTP